MVNAEMSCKIADYRCEELHFYGLPHEFQEKQIKGKQNQLDSEVGWGYFDPVASDFDFCQGKSLEKDVFSADDLHPLSQFLTSDDIQLDAVPLSIPSFNEPQKFHAGLECIPGLLDARFPGRAESKKEKPHPISSTSLEILNMRAGSKLPIGTKTLELTKEASCPASGSRRLSTEEIMRVAGASYIRFSDEMDSDPSMLQHQITSTLMSAFDEEMKDIQLAHLLLASVEKVGNQQYDRASGLLMQCEYLSSVDGNPVQRLVFYFAKALNERIGRETGRMPLAGLEMKAQFHEKTEEHMMGPHPALLAGHQLIPFSQILQFTLTQAILDNLALAKRIHVIDLGIRIGLQWTVLMRALTERFACPVELLKISAVGTWKEGDRIEETGKWLASFADSLNLPFVFKTVIVSDMQDLKVDQFELAADEAVAVHVPTILRTMIFRPECLENLMRVIRGLKPCIMSVAEVEANHNSTSFITRFIEALFFYSAWFDCLDECMARNDSNRRWMEGHFFSQGIQNMVAAEGCERTVRHVGLDIWRSFFRRFRFVEVELSEWSLYQADLLVKQFACASSCTLDLNGKGLVIGWKGTPLHSVSAWKLQ